MSVEEHGQWRGEEEYCGSATVPPDFVHEEIFNDFYCGAQHIPKDIYIRVIRKTYSSWEVVDPEVISPALSNEGVISHDDFQYYTNPRIHAGERRNRLLYHTLVTSGFQRNILVKVYQALLRSPLQHVGLAEEIRRCALTECGMANVVTPGESRCRAVGKLIKTLEGKCITATQAVALAKSFQLSAAELGDPPETDLSTLSDRWMKRDQGATPEGLVEALMCCKGLGKYVSGMGLPHNPPSAQNFINGLGCELPKFAAFLGYPESAYGPEATPMGNSYANQAAKLLQEFKMPDCGVSTVQILYKTAQKAGALPQKKQHPFATPTDHWVSPEAYQPHNPDDPKRKPIPGMPLPMYRTSDQWARAEMPPPGGFHPSHVHQAQKEPYESYQEQWRQQSIKSDQEDNTLKAKSTPTRADEKTPPVPKKSVSCPTTLVQRTPMYRSDLLLHCMKGKSDDCEVVQHLLDSGATIDIQAEDDGSHPLHLAVVSKSEEMFHLVLLQYGGRSVDVVRDDHRTPLMVACVEKQYGFVKALIERGANVNAKDSDGLACLHYKETLECVETVELLLEHNANVDITSEDKHLTPLNNACYIGLVDTVRVFLRHLAKVEGDEKGIITPLCYAAGAGHVPIVELLIHHGAKVNHPDKVGRTPLHWACLGQKLNVVSCLIDASADVDYADKEGIFPVLLAVQRIDHKLLQLLIKAKADLNKTMVKISEHAPKEIEITPLIAASMMGELSLVQTLVENKANVNYTSERTVSALSYAVAGGHYDVVEYLLKLNEITKTIESLAVPLQLVPKSDNRQIAALLLETLGGADRVLLKAPQYGLEKVVEEVCKLANVKQRAGAARQGTNVAVATVPRKQSRATDEMEMERIFSTFILATTKTAEKKKRRHYLTALASTKGHQHITDFLDKYYEKKLKDLDDFLLFINTLPYPSPAHFIFGREDLFDGQTFRTTLEEMGAIDVVENLVLALWQMPELDQEFFVKLDGKGLLTVFMGPRFVNEVEQVRLLDSFKESETSRDRTSSQIESSPVPDGNRPTMHATYETAVRHEERPATVEASPSTNSASVQHLLSDAQIPYWDNVTLFKDLASQVHGWRELAQCLQCGECVKQIESQYAFESEQCYHMLDTWWKKRGERATYSELANALHNSRQDNLISILRDHQKKSSGPAATHNEEFKIDDLSRDEEVFSVCCHVSQYLQQQKGSYSKARLIVLLDNK